MFSDVVLTVRTGVPGSGKSYWAVKEIYQNLLEFYGRDMKIVTNLPVARPDARIEVREWTESDLDCPTYEEYANCVLIIDEVQRFLNKKNAPGWLKFISEARHHDIRLQFLTQDKDNLPEGFDGLIDTWYESTNGQGERDPYIGMLIYDWSGIWAKLGFRFRNYFKITEYRKVERRWKAQGGHQEWFDPAIGALYNSRNKSLTDTEAKEKKHDYQRNGWFKFLRQVHHRNPGCLFRAFGLACKTVAPVGLGVGCLVGGMIWFWSGSKKAESVAIVRSEPVRPLSPSLAHLVQAPAVVKVEEPKATTSVVQGVADVIAGKKPVKKAIKKRVVSWCVLFCLVLVGCVSRNFDRIEPYADASHVVRKARSFAGDPGLAIQGAGHSLDEVAAVAGLSPADSGLEVEGPAVGREVIDKARLDLGLDVDGTKLVPARRRWVPVPAELGGDDDVADEIKVVGGRRVARVTQVERDLWRDVSDVRHECYCCECLLVSVNASDSKQLSIGVGAQASYTVQYPTVPGVAWWTGSAAVSFKGDGTWVRGREIGRPVLRMPDGQSANIHVGGKFPYRLASSTSNVGGTQTTLGATVQNIVTGTEVTMTVKRCSQTQVEIKGSVKISATNGTNDSIPITTERSATLGQIIDLGKWQLAARLDSASVSRSGQWISLGGLFAGDEQTFVVLVRVVQDVLTDVPERVENLPPLPVPGPSPAGDGFIGPRLPDDLGGPVPGWGVDMGPPEKPKEPVEVKHKTSKKVSAGDLTSKPKSSGALKPGEKENQIDTGKSGPASAAGGQGGSGAAAGAPVVAEEEEDEVKPVKPAKVINKATGRPYGE